MIEEHATARLKMENALRNLGHLFTFTSVYDADFKFHSTSKHGKLINPNFLKAIMTNEGKYRKN